MTLLVLTSEENFVWHSMQEIIPFLEHQWKNLEKQNHDVHFANVDKLTLAEILPLALRADQIVLTCFNFKICKIAAFIRFNLKINVNFAFHVHNMATIAFWPFRAFGDRNFFKKNDLFITSCSNDQKTLNAVFENPRITKLPFNLLSAPNSQLNKTYLRAEELLYIGRISPQKNLHNLILAYNILIKRRVPHLPQLIFFGKEDHLGSPNMGIENKSYQAELDSLVKNLNLQDYIKFEGHKNRESIASHLINNSCLVISPSLHSDENFGMAVLQAILTGNNVVISDWGGHSDFKKYFFERVHLFPITQSNLGPSLSAQTIADNLEPLLINRPLRGNIIIPKDFSTEFQTSILTEALISDYSDESLFYTDLSESIFKQRQFYASESATRIFTDYTDPLFSEISSCYIGQLNRRKQHSLNPRLFRHFLVPWAQIEENTILINDPHKGLQKYICPKATDNGLEIMSADGKSLLILDSDLQELTNLAWLYSD